VNTVLEEEREVGAALALDERKQGDGGPPVAVEVADVWFVLGRMDESEYRTARADRLIATIGPEYRAWWLYPGAFDSQLAAAQALVEILDPNGAAQPPPLNAILVEEDTALMMARMQPSQRDAFTSTIAFFIDRILLPFVDTSSFYQYQEVDREQGQVWTGRDFNNGIDLLRTMQELLEVKDGQQVIPIGRDTEIGADAGGDCGDRADSAD